MADGTLHLRLPRRRQPADPLGRRVIRRGERFRGKLSPVLRTSDPYLSPNAFVDSDHPEVIRYAEPHRSAAGEVETAVALYYAIRDGFLYNPYEVSLSPEGYRASDVAARSYERGGHCIDKALLLAGCARAVGIPSRLHFAIVRNHIGTAKLEAALGTDLLVFHGYAELLLDGSWVAATPAFNRQLCERLSVPPLEWDGRSDAIFQAFSPDGARFMEYVHDYGHFADVPFELMLSEWRKHYPAIRSGRWPGRGAHNVRAG